MSVIERSWRSEDSVRLRPETKASGKSILWSQSRSMAPPLVQMATIRARHEGAGGEAVPVGRGDDGALEDPRREPEQAREGGGEQAGDEDHRGDPEQEVAQEHDRQAGGGVAPEDDLAVAWGADDHELDE